eukprot:753861-Hanusia_phi.AAC.5
MLPRGSFVTVILRVRLSTRKLENPMSEWLGAARALTDSSSRRLDESDQSSSVGTSNHCSRVSDAADSEPPARGPGPRPGAGLGIRPGPSELVGRGCEARVGGKTQW